MRKRAKIYIFHCYKSLGVRDKHRLKSKKKLLDRKTEAISLAQKSGRSELIPLWCNAPENISPPETVPSPSPSPSEATPLEALSFEASEPKRKKKNKNKKAHPQQSLGSRFILLCFCTSHLLY